MSTIKTDIELSKHFGNEVYDEYRSALDFIHLDARNSLLKFRLITEVFCRRMLNGNNISTQEDNLHSQIDELSQCQIIHHEFKDRLHKVRKLCNKNVHATELSSESSNEDNIKNLKASYTAQLREDAILARELTVRNMEDIFPILTKSKTNISVIMTDIPDNSWSKTLIDAATTSCARTQLQAGKIYEAQANDMRKKDPFNFEHDFCYRYNGLKKLAATYYEMSFKISADVGTNETKLLLDIISEPLRNNEINEQKTEVNNENYSPVQIFKEHSNPEALYSYWSVIQEMGSFDGEWITEYQWMLEASAKLGHPEAQAVYACRLLKNGEFDSALSMLENAITFEIDAAYLGIATYYNDKRTGKRDIKKALGYLNKGAEINGPDCLCTLGKLYYTGTWVEKSESKGTEYILQAIQFGSIAAEDYYFKDILRVKEKQREKFENDISKDLNNVIKLFNGRNQTISNIGRNDPCHCGSGKKHKKCCLNNKHIRDKAVKDMASSLFPD